MPDEMSGNLSDHILDRIIVHRPIIADEWV